MSFSRRVTALFLPIILIGPLLTAASAADFTVEPSPGGAVVKLDGQIVTEYLTKSGHKPILWPLNGPTGKPLTRPWPMQGEPGESKDHVHHRSFWFDHGDVNGIDFWGEDPKKSATIRHREFVELRGGATGRMVTLNDWIGLDGKKVCEDRRAFTFRSAPDQRIIDFEVVVTASDGPLTFGDTKEGSFGLRMADSIRVDGKHGGRIVDSHGRTDAAAWGRRADWVDYHGPVDGQTVGIAILNHPSSFNYPTRWHVRTYGLFAANPFGRKDFPPDDSGLADPPMTLAAGHSLTLRYRVILHTGDEKSAHIADAFVAYSKESFAAP